MSAAAYAAMVSELVGLGFPLSAAEAKARATYPETAQALDVAVVKRANVLEKDEQRIVRKMALAVGFKVYWLSQARDSKQTPGLPDLWLACEATGLCAWWETKRQVGGARSTAQEEFAAECIASRIPYGFGDRYEFARWLTANGFTAPPIPQD